jgi:hypothetical protein
MCIIARFLFLFFSYNFIYKYNVHIGQTSVSKGGLEPISPGILKSSRWPCVRVYDFVQKDCLDPHNHLRFFKGNIV